MDVSHGIFAITLIVEDLPKAKAFYASAFGQSVAFEDDASAVYRVGATMVNLLKSEAAPALVDPAPVGSPGGVRAVYTIQVEDVDAAAAELAAAGVELLNGPMDRPWGPRTLSFRDPFGTVWELSGSRGRQRAADPSERAVGDHQHDQERAGDEHEHRELVQAAGVRALPEEPRARR